MVRVHTSPAPLKLPDDPAIRSRIFVPSEVDQHPLLRAALGGEWSYAGGMGTSAQTAPMHSRAGALGLDHRAIHAELERTQTRRAFTLAQAESGMLEIGSPAFEARFPLGTVTTKGTIGEGLLNELPVSLLVRQGDKLTEMSGVQRGTVADRHGMAQSLRLQVGGQERLVPFQDIEVAFVRDPYVHHIQAARARGLSEVDVSKNGEAVIRGLEGSEVTVVAQERRYVPHGSPDRRAVGSFTGTLHAEQKPGMFSLTGVEGFFTLKDLESGRLFSGAGAPAA